MPLPKAIAERCREALEPFAKLADYGKEWAHPPKDDSWGTFRVAVGDLRRARDMHTELSRIIAAGDAVPAGWRLVPVEPVNEQCIAILEALQDLGSGKRTGLTSRVVYDAMLSASPTPPVAAGDETREAIRNAALEFAEAGNDTAQKAAWQKLNDALATLAGREGR